MSVSRTEPRHDAGVRFPPPFIYVGGFLVGWLLQRWRPLPMTDGPSPIRVAIGVLCAIVFVGLSLGGIATFRRARTTIVPNRPASSLVSHGPYRFTRNPMYTGLAALYLGAALLGNMWWPVVVLPFVLVIVDRFVIAREESYLRDAFPAEYPAYCARVRRWL